MTIENQPSSEPFAPCPRCERPLPLCLCAFAALPRLPFEILILQHPQEQDRILGSVPLILRSLPRVTVRVGLSWASFSRATENAGARARSWRVLFSSKMSEADKTSALGRTLPRRVQGLIVLDGSWDQAKTLWWRNPWLLKVPRLDLGELGASIYGRLRREPKVGHVSTVEAVAAALDLVGPKDAPHGEELRRRFRTLMQRARDSKITAKPRRPRSTKRSPPARKP